MSKSRFNIISRFFYKKKMKTLFNIYYINFAKVYEIKMMLGNEISTSKKCGTWRNVFVRGQFKWKSEV